MNKYYKLINENESNTFNKKLFKHKTKKNKLKTKIVIAKSILNILLLIIYAIIIKNFIDKEKIKNNIKVCLCVVGKKENMYAKEYVNYYKKLGYNHIYIYDNNDINDEKFESVLSEEINSNYVTIVNYRGLKGRQCEAYQDCYKKYNKYYNWLSFYDFDEFLEVYRLFC